MQQHFQEILNPEPKYKQFWVVGFFYYVLQSKPPLQKLYSEKITLPPFLPHDNSILFAESVETECSFGIKNPDKQIVDQTMKKLGLFPFKERHPNTLSSGQKQRIAVAVSMICNKALLVFDEPTSGLDYDSMAQVAGLIRDLADCSARKSAR